MAAPASSSVLVVVDDQHPVAGRWAYVAYALPQAFSFGGVAASVVGHAYPADDLRLVAQVPPALPGSAEVVGVGRLRFHGR